MTKKQYRARWHKLAGLQWKCEQEIMKAAKEIYTKRLLNKLVLKSDFYEDAFNNLNEMVRLYSDMAHKDKGL